MQDQSEASPCVALDAATPEVLGDDAIERLRAIAIQHGAVAAGTRIFRAGEPFRAIYGVRIGAIKAIRYDGAGEEQVVAFHLPGEFFGLTGIHSDRYVNTAVALERTAVCGLPYQRLFHVANDHPRLRRQLMRLMSGVILTEQDQYAAMAGHTADARLAFLLLDLRERMSRGGALQDRLRLPMTRAELGSSAGLAPETTSRVFQQFRRRELIEASGRNIRFLDLAGLRRLAVPLTHPGDGSGRTTAA
ncbi:helix-turn-helix domain-containing protein [Spiribacter onubensis]|uniref:Helix-turn-helix domain-containing protein n=1 Tax=Spiribacter onubensis TaxID=3122420 RepID=A0ABV3S8I8_9GAMM